MEWNIEYIYAFKRMKRIEHQSLKAHKCGIKRVLCSTLQKFKIIKSYGV